MANQPIYLGAQNFGDSTRHFYLGTLTALSTHFAISQDRQAGRQAGGQLSRQPFIMKRKAESQANGKGASSKKSKTCA
jgi:hypothetical protein